MKVGIVAALAIPLFLRVVSAQAPKPGDEVDLAPLGRAITSDGTQGVEWDEPRVVRRVVLDFDGAPPAADAVKLEYWVSNWPPAPSGGWTKTDTRWQGEWRSIRTIAALEGRSVEFRFTPLAEAENPNARNTPGYAPSYRKTLKVRLRGAGRLRIYGASRWNQRVLNVQTGCGGKEPVTIAATAYNGMVLGSEPVAGDPAGTKLTVLYTEHDPGSNDRTILTIRAGAQAFGVAVDDVIERKSVYVQPFGIFIGDSAAGADFRRYLESGALRPGADIISRTEREPEQTLVRAMGEIPALSLTARQASHRLRYYPLGFTGSREKYGLDFNGNLFINKHGVKAMKEDLARMLWEGDEIYFRIGTGARADFREREHAARQQLLEGWLPLVTTRWETDGIDYEEQAYSTLLDAPLDDVRLRGDEPSVALLRLTARNASRSAATARVWFDVSPEEPLELRNGLLLASGNRLRAALEPQEGSLSAERKAATWTITLPPGESRTLVIKVPFRTIESAEQQEAVRRIGFDTRLTETLAYWRRLATAGLRIRVPDEELNRFYLAVLQHILLTSEKDVSTGYLMCPCGTYDYNMFANETAVQVRLLEMRGLHDQAWRCLRPIVELQGSKAFPGRFQETSAVFHGVRVDADHDYTHSGYNLNHGWILWTLAEHYLYTQDAAWLKTVSPRMLKAAEWIIRERRANMAEGPEHGLLPAGQLEDNEDFEHWFAVNAYAYRGLHAASAAISAIDKEAGLRLDREAQAYREDIRRAAFRSMSLSPVVPLRDGTFVPAIAPRTSLHGRDVGWIRNILYGSLTLVDCGVFSTDEPVTQWILQDYEDNLFMSDESMGVPDRDWFSRGGMTLQPNLVNTPVAYLERDQTRPALRAFYNTFVASYYPDVAEFTEWVPSLGTSGGPFFKTSDEAALLTWLRLMLVRESGDSILLNSGTPRHWFQNGETIEVGGCPTFLGKLSYRTESHAAEGRIDATVDLDATLRAKQVQLRLRHPEGKRIARLEIDGRPSSSFDAEKEMISVPVTPGTHQIRAYY